MAIKIKRDSNFFYAGVIGLLDQEEKKRADKIYEKTFVALRELDNKIKKKKITDFLQVWHLRGGIVNGIISSFKMSQSEKKYFWLMLYDVAGMNIPDRAKKFHIQNDFRVANIISSYSLVDLKKVGPWALWREIIGSTKIGNDERVAKWVADYILKRKIKTRNAARPLLKAVRNRLKKLNTTVLSNKELTQKLKEVSY